MFHGYRLLKKETCLHDKTRTKNQKYQVNCTLKKKEIINWYDKNFPNDFDLYGEGWNKRYFSGNKIIRALNRINMPNWLTMYSAPKTYKGFIDDKLKATSKYKFCFTYENTCAENDYLSEKIFDCMIAGSVPIYLGCLTLKRLFQIRLLWMQESLLHLKKYIIICAQ